MVLYPTISQFKWCIFSILAREFNRQTRGVKTKLHHYLYVVQGQILDKDGMDIKIMSINAIHDTERALIVLNIITYNIDTRNEHLINASQYNRYSSIDTKDGHDNNKYQ